MDDTLELQETAISESTHESHGQLPVQMQETRFASKEKSDDQLQTCSPPPTHIMVLPRARRLTNPLFTNQTFAPIAQRSDLTPCTSEIFDEETTQHRLGQYQQLEYSEQCLRPGWLYLFKEGKLWKEFQVNCTHNIDPLAILDHLFNEEQRTTFAEVQLHPEQKSTVREAGAVERPYLLLPQDIEFDMAWSEIQWGWDRIESMADESLRQKRCVSISLPKAQSQSNAALQHYSSESYQLYADTSIPQWIRSLTSSMFSAESNEHPVQHIITVQFEDYLEIGRELANRYQRAVVGHDNLIAELQDSDNSGDFPQGSPKKYPYRFARWFNSAQLVYQQVFSADQQDKNYFSKQHSLHTFRSQLDIKDIYVALGIDARRLARTYAEQCHWQLMNFIRGQYESPSLTEEMNATVIDTVHTHVTDYQSLPALSDVIIDIDGHPLEPTEADDLLYFAMLFNRIGEVACMKDITLDGNQEAFLAAKSYAEKHACVALLFEINGHTPGNPWYQYIKDRPPTNENGETKDSASSSGEFQISRRLGQLFTAIVSDMMGPHIGADKQRLISTKDRLFNLIHGKIQFSHAVTFDRIANLDGLGWDNEAILKNGDRKKYLLSQAIRPDHIQYPKKEDIQPRKDQLKRVQDNNIERINSAYNIEKPRYKAQLKLEQKRLNSVAQLNADKAKAAAFSDVTSTNSKLTQLDSIRQRQHVVHTENTTRHQAALTKNEKSINSLQMSIDENKATLKDLNEQKAQTFADTKTIDKEIGVIGNNYAEKIFLLEIKAATGGLIKKGLNSPLAKLLPTPAWLTSFANESGSDLEKAINERKQKELKKEIERDHVITKRNDISQKIINKNAAISHQTSLMDKRVKEKKHLEMLKNSSDNQNKKSVIALDQHENTLRTAEKKASANHSTISQKADSTLANKKRQNSDVVKNKLKTFESRHKQKISAIKEQYQSTVKSLETQTYQKHLADVANAESHAASTGERLLNPAAPGDIALDGKLKAIKAGRFTLEDIIPTNTPEEYAKLKSNNAAGALVLTNKETEIWKDLISKEVHMVSVTGNVEKHVDKFLIHRNTTESFLAHKERVAQLGALVVGFEAITLFDNCIKLHDQHAGNKDLRPMLNVIGSIFDTGDAVASVVKALYERRVVSLSLRATNTVPLTTELALANSRRALVTKAATGFMCIANFYSAAMCFYDFQDRSLKNDDSRWAFAMQGVGFTISGVGTLLAIKMTAPLVMVMPVIGLVILAIGTMAYYLWWTEDMDVLEMWLKHGPFSTTQESLINYKGSVYQTRLFNVTINEVGQTNYGQYSFFDKNVGILRMPEVVLQDISIGSDVIVLKKPKDLRPQSIWINPNNYQLLAAEQAIAFNEKTAKYQHGCLMYTTEGDDTIYHLDNARLGRIGDTVGEGHVEIGDHKHLLAYLSPDIEINSERFDEPFDSSQKDKVNPKEWEMDGQRCWEALKAGLYPAKVELELKAKEVIDTRKDNALGGAQINTMINHDGIFYNGNLAEITITIPPDIPSDAWVTVMLMRVDNNIVIKNDYYVMQRIPFSLNARPEEFGKQGISLLFSKDKKSVSVLIDIDKIDNQDLAGIQNTTSHYISEKIHHFDAWVNFEEKAILQQKEDDTFSKNIRPYRTTFTKSIIDNIEWRAKTKSPKNNKTRIGWYTPNDLVSHTINRPI